MRSAKSNAAWEHLTRLVLPLLLAVLNCAPRVEDCRNLLPVMEGPVTVVQTPLGTTGCSCVTEDVVVMVEARRHYFSWERGQLWIDGHTVAMEEFSARLAEAKDRHRAERMGAAIEERTRPVRKAVHDLGKKLNDLFK
jgi:hypothetical protein